MTRTVTITGGPLSIDDVVAVAAGEATVEIDPSVADRMAAAQEVIDAAVASGAVVYGVTTGFGALAGTRVDPSESAAMQVALLRSHAAGVGDPLPAELVRAMLLLRARTLAQGHSGVRPVVVERIVDLLRHGVFPVVPSQGSVGASGDLAPFAHLALPLIGEGEVMVGGDRMSAAEGLSAVGLEPITLRPKEGLSLLNGTEGLLAHLVLAIHRLRRLTDTADMACALSVEALMGSQRPFMAEIHALRPHPGQIESARRIREAIDGSGIDASHHDDFDHAVQDAYSLRCAPQVHGAARDVIEFTAGVADRELGAVVDNPIVLDSGEVVSAGNFHGQPLAFALDFLAMAATELASISERRTDRLLDPTRSAGLPPFLATRPGLDSGYMLAQYTAAALVAESRVLCHPASVDSIPTSGLQEDHVSMGWGAGRKLMTVLDNVERVLAVELLCAAEGVDLRGPLLPAPGTASVHRAIRSVVSPLDGDRPPGPDIEAIAGLVREGRVAGSR
ncbi:MAG TPA: histidine ammonia-lyase [Acidimicrobiia bacterium]|nr:histidine ammonia-lyase [Acidimicrobiia bacterium]